MKIAQTTALLSLALLTLGACQTTREDERDRGVPALLREGRYARALEQAEREHRRRPDDPEAEDEYRLASTAVLLERGRRTLFEGNNTEALELFLEAKRLAPEQPVIDDWIYNVRQKLALHWQRQGMVAQADGDLNLAVEHFNKSLEYLPDFERSRAALMRVLLQLNYRAGLGEKYYEEGVRDLHEHLLEEADFGFSAALKYSPDSERAGKRLERTRTQLAEERATIAVQLELAGAYAAARNEFRVALLLDEDCELALEGLARAEREAEAAEYLREADRRILRKEYDLAREALEAGRALSEFQQPAFDDLEQAIAGAMHSDLYQEARTLESDEQYEAAVAAYADLLEQATYFEDAITRKSTLEDYIEDAERLYAKAEAAGSIEEQLGYLRQIAVFWPDYRDVAERLGE